MLDINTVRNLCLEYGLVKEDINNSSDIPNINQIDVRDITSLPQAKRIVQNINRHINTELKKVNSNLKVVLKDEKYIFKEKGTDMSFTFQIVYLGNEFIEPITDNIVVKSKFYKLINGIVDLYFKNKYKNEVYNSQSKPHIQYVFSVGNN